MLTVPFLRTCRSIHIGSPAQTLSGLELLFSNFKVRLEQGCTSLRLAYPHAGARPTKPFPTGTAVHPLQPAQQHQSQLQPQQQQLPQQGVNWTQVSTAHCPPQTNELGYWQGSASHCVTAGGI